MALYEPPTLKRNAWRWYIEYYQTDPVSKALKRFRPTFNLNRKKYLENEALRLQRAAELVALITASLPFGYPFACGLLMPGLVAALQQAKPAKAKKEKPKKEKNGQRRTPLNRALDTACRIKCDTDRDETIRTYQSITKLLKAFFEAKGWGALPVGKVKLRHAIAYMDHCTLERKLGNNTWNNNLRDAKVLFNALKERGYVKVNPFDGIKYKPKQEKARKNFTAADARTVARVMYEKRRLLFYALICEYACFVRPAELRRLRREDFDLEAGIINLSGKQTKGKKRRTATIPDAFLPFFREAEFEAIPADHFVWGKNLEPHPRIQCGEKSMYNAHRRILEVLWANDAIERRAYSWYSWKDSGITNALQELRANAVRDQAGHGSEAVTMLYYHKPVINAEMKKFRNELLELEEK